MGSQAYKLDIPNNWNIHPIVSITVLEPSPSSDPYRCPKANRPEWVFIKGNTPADRSYEIKKLINRRVIRKGRSYLTQYLIR